MGPLDYYFNLVDFLSRFPWGIYFIVVQLIALVITVVALVWYFTSIKKLKELSIPIPIDEEAPSTLPKEIVAGPWIEIQQKMTSSNSADWSIAVIQADSVLDKILKSSGYLGDTMGDRLKQIDSAELSSIDDVWRSHKLRNRLAHGGEGTLTRPEAEEAIKGYKKAFQELNYID